MRKSWSACRNILCIRPDNMGDLLMSTPAIRALKETFQCRITVLTSSMAAGIAGHIPEIDEVIVYDLPWVKKDNATSDDTFFKTVEDIKSRAFDAAVIFTVYSQNPLPAAMLAYLANIPRRLAYCRENPYELLTDWIPDKEPYTLIRHQVRRDLALVAGVGANTMYEKLSLQLPGIAWSGIIKKLGSAGIDIKKPWLILHAGVSEKKREYPETLWVEAGKELITELQLQVLLTGSSAEKGLTDSLAQQMGTGAFSLAGSFTLDEFIILIHHAPLLLSVNTGPVHIAAATATPVIVLYALTNPQHLPWKVPGKPLLFDIPENMRSKNEVIAHVHKHAFPEAVMASPAEIIHAVRELLIEKTAMPAMPEMISVQKSSIK